MAKRITMMVPLYEPPPVTKEEALSGRASWYEPPDGFDGKGGGEAPSEYDLDRMVYPHDCGPIEKAQYESQANRDKQIEAFRDADIARSRQFTISEDSLTGEDPGPPSAFDDEKEK